MRVADMGIEGAGIVERQMTDLSFGRHSTTCSPSWIVWTCYRAIVRSDSVDQRTAVFLVRRQLAYLYEPNGIGLQQASRRRRYQFAGGTELVSLGALRHAHVPKAFSRNAHRPRRSRASRLRVQSVARRISRH